MSTEALRVSIASRPDNTARTELFCFSSPRLTKISFHKNKSIVHIVYSGEQNGGPPVVPRPTRTWCIPALAEWRADRTRGAALLPILRMRPQHGKRRGRYGARSGPPPPPFR